MSTPTDSSGQASAPEVVPAAAAAAHDAAASSAIERKGVLECLANGEHVAKPIPAPPLTDEQTRLALGDLFVRLRYPKMERKLVDPAIDGQSTALFSFVPAKGAKANKKGVFGFAKFRGAFRTDEEAAERAEYIVREVSDLDTIYHVDMGVPFPVTVSSDYSAKVEKVDTTKEASKAYAAETKAKKALEKKEIDEVKARQENLESESEKEISDVTERYSMLRAKKAQLVWTYIETEKKMKEYQRSIISTIADIKAIDDVDPGPQKAFLAKYIAKRRAVGISEEKLRESMFRYMLEDAKLDFLTPVEGNAQEFEAKALEAYSAKQWVEAGNLYAKAASEAYKVSNHYERARLYALACKAYSNDQVKVTVNERGERSASCEGKDRAIICYGILVSESSKVVNMHPVQLAFFNTSLGELYALQGKMRQAKTHLLAAVELYLGEGQLSGAISVLSTYASLLVARGLFEDAADQYHELYLKAGQSPSTEWSTQLFATRWLECLMAVDAKKLIDDVRAGTKCDKNGKVTYSWKPAFLKTTAALAEAGEFGTQVAKTIEAIQSGTWNGQIGDRDPIPTRFFKASLAAAIALGNGEQIQMAPALPEVETLAPAPLPEALPQVIQHDIKPDPNFRAPPAAALPDSIGELDSDEEDEDSDEEDE